MSDGPPQLYFLHIPKTAGSSLHRMLEDSWPAGAIAPQRFLGELLGAPPEELARYPVISGHHGIAAATGNRRVVTVLRDPLARAVSHYHAPGASRFAGFESIGALLDDPAHSWIARDYQARWLAIPPSPAESAGGLAPSALDGVGNDRELERRALAMLERCELAGTAERLDEFAEALGRLLGRRLAAPPRINVGPDASAIRAADAARVRATSRIDARLYARANALLDRALATLPQLPREPVVERYTYSMADALCGTGWHARMLAPDVGWHRWTGPGTRSELRLPVRLDGATRLAVAIASACDDDAVRSLRVAVQGAPVRHDLEPARHGTRAVASVELDRRRPLTITLEVSRTRQLVDAATGRRSEDPAALAIGDIALVPALGGPERTSRAASRG